MNINRTLVKILAGLVAVAALFWLGFEFLYKGTITIESAEQNLTISITSSSGQQIATGQQKSYRVAPGAYTVSVTTAQSGAAKYVTVGPLSTAKMTVPSTPKLQTSLLARTALYQAIPAGDSVIGYDPATQLLTRVDKLGDKTNVVTGNLLASQVGEAEPEIATKIVAYQPYRQDQAIVSANGLLYVVSKTAVTELSVEGIPIDHASTETPYFVIATQPELESFAVAYKKDVYLYKNTASKPQKIYTASKQFDSLTYSKNMFGLYYAGIPTSKEDMRAAFSDYQFDLLLVDTAHNNQEQTVTGPINQATLSPDSALATIRQRGTQPYLFNPQSKQKVADIDAPLIVGPYWVSNTTYLYSKNKTIWRYDTTQQQSELLGDMPSDVTSLFKNATGDFTVTTYHNKNDASIYRLGAASAVTAVADKLKTALPYIDSDIHITYTILGTPSILIQTKAPLNSASQLPRYRQQTAELRQRALDYLTSHGIELREVTITYDPADPL